MNREIKFRGKSLKTGEWVYGLLHKCIGKAKLKGWEMVKGKCNPVINEASIDRWWILIPRMPEDYDWDLRDTFSPILVNPNTVGQFTGLYDKNGKEIYEGDIVDAWSAGSHLTNGIIKWGLCRFFIGNEPPSIIWSLTSNSENKDELLEVVGNIHDNPELLK